VKEVIVELGERSYPVRIGHGIIGPELDALHPLDEIALITDESVARQPWFEELEEVLRARSAKFVLFRVPAGEPSKDLGLVARALSEMAKASLSRRAAVVAVGGGVVGDLAGFTAAIYLRGVRLIHIPTTLLACVDSSIGGKTGVNLPEGKNLVGAFHQPERVVMELDFLGTLPPREFSAGMAEVIKYGVISDPALFAQCEPGRPADLAEVVGKCVAIKGGIVSRDEKEISGERATLNFGHTLGHAIEQSAGYGTLLHGEAVSLGMIAACVISERKAGLDPAVTARVREACRKNGLPVAFPGLGLEQLRPALLRDKKATSTKLRWVLAPEIGRTELRDDVSDDDIEAAIHAIS
jgi:3-dehydroquinate synthase